MIYKKITGVLLIFIALSTIAYPMILSFGFLRFIKDVFLAIAVTSIFALGIHLLN